MHLNSNVLTEKEAAQYLNLSRATLRRARMQGPRNGHIASPPYLKMGRSVRYLRKDCDKWLEEHRVTSHYVGNVG